MRALSLRNKILLGYLLPTALAVAASALVYRTLVVSIATGEQVSRTSQVIAYANVAIRSVVEAEAGARAFASVGDSAGLQRYNEALKTFDKISRRLGEMAHDSASQRARLDKAKAIAAGWVSDVAAPLIAARRLTPAGLARAGDRLLVAVLQLRAAEPTGGTGNDAAQAAAFRNRVGGFRLELERALRLMPNDFERWVRLGTLASDYESACVRRTADRHARGAELEALAAALAQRAGEEEAAITATLADREPKSGRAGLDPFRAEMGEFVEKETESLDQHRRASDAAVQTGKIVAIAGPGLAAALALILGLVLSLGIVRSVRSVASAAQALMAGHADQRARADANDEVGVMAQTFNVMADSLTARNREAALLSQFGGLLSACTTLDEAYGIIERLCQQLLPANSGALYVVPAGQKSVERAAAWGDAAETLGPSFAPEECWAIRRGKSHLATAGADGIPCAHVAADPRTAPAGHACIPIMAQGELLSVLCLRFAGAPQRRVDEELRLAGTVAEPVALALANLRLRERLQNQSIRDPLTGLFNRRFLNETFAKELSSARRHKRGLGVMVLDVDHFKRFNDTFGHAAGDTLLAAVGKLLADSFRNEDIVCRFGGEEFVVVLPYAGLEDTARRADELRVAISRLKLQHQGTALGPITASLGVAAYPVHGHDEATLIGAADAALYEAKHAGRNRVVTAAAPDLPGTGASAGQG